MLRVSSSELSLIPVLHIVLLIPNLYLSIRYLRLLFRQFRYVFLMVLVVRLFLHHATYLLGFRVGIRKLLLVMLRS